MNVFAPSRFFDPDCPELMDRPDTDRAVLQEELQILEHANSRWGGHQLALQYVQKFVDLTGAKSLSLLDLATGAADVPRAIAMWARQRQLPIAITAVDSNPRVLQIAKDSCRDWPEIQLEQYDMRALPYAPDSFDLVLSSQAFHHFDSADAIVILRQIKEIARHGYVVSDLRRNWLLIWSMELLARIVIRSRIFRHDLVQSCRAAFTVREWRAMAGRAQLNNFQIHRRQLFFRIVLEGRK